MTDVLIAVVGILLCSALLSTVLRGQRPELALCLGLAAGTAVALLLIGQVLPLLTAVRKMLDETSVPAAYLTVVLKAVGICMLTRLTADTCRDAGETALAGKAETAGRILLLVLAVPLYEQLLTLVNSLIQATAVTS